MKTITLGVKGKGNTPAWSANTHRFVVKEETAEAFIGWTLSNYQRDSGMEPCVCPKFAWEEKRIERNRKARINRKARREVMESLGLKSYRVGGKEIWE